MAKKSTAQKLVDAMEVVQALSGNTQNDADLQKAVKSMGRKRAKVEPITVAEEPEPDMVAMDDDLVIRRSMGDRETVMASVPVMLLTLNETFDLLFASKWFRLLTVKLLREGLMYELDGEPRASLKIATKQEIIDLAAQGIRVTSLPRAVEKDKARRSNAGATVTHEDGTTTVRPPKAARAPKPPKDPAAPKQPKAKKGNVEFIFTIPTGKALENRLANMPKQGRILMEIAAEAGQARMNGEALDAVLQAGAPGKGVLPKIVPLVLQRFKAFIRDGVYDGLVTKEESK